MTRWPGVVFLLSLWWFCSPFKDLASTRRCSLSKIMDNPKLLLSFGTLPCQWEIHGNTLCMNDVPFFRGPHCPLNINTFSNILHQRYCKNLIWNQGGPETTEEVLCAPLVNDIHIYIYIYTYTIYIYYNFISPKKNLVTNWWAPTLAKSEIGASGNGVWPTATASHLWRKDFDVFGLRYQRCSWLAWYWDGRDISSWLT